MAGAAAAGAIRTGADGAPLTTVRVGLNNIIPDAPFLLAEQRGYFAAEGLHAEFSKYGSLSDMVVPIGTGGLDVGGGSPVAQLYNAVARNIKLRLVADRGSDPPGYGYNPLIVRSDLIKSGRVKTPADLKGLKVANNGPGSVSSSTLNELLKKYGLKMSDVTRVYLDYPEHVIALTNGSIDASLSAEPTATQAERLGVAAGRLGNDTWYPYQQISVVIYSEAFANMGDLPHRFMRAYLRAARFYIDALKNSRFAGPNANAVVDVLTKSTPIKDANLYKSIVPSAINPDGKLYLASLHKDVDFYRSQNLLEGNVDIDKVIDNQFIYSAQAKLGPHKPGHNH